ncbi:MAG TPA: GyrI-like domain-containing protein [Bacillota bacterium]|nr:GyrI-like domain-containing protein [Bacillota bacterium]
MKRPKGWEEKQYHWEGREEMQYKAEIREIPEHIVYFKKYFVEDLTAFFDSMAKDNFLQELSDRVLLENPGIRLTEPDYNVLLFTGGEYREKNVGIEFCDAVTAFGKDTGEYKFRGEGSFTALCILHKGPYRGLAEAYDFAYRWMEQNGYQKSGCPRNSAIDGFWNREREEDYLTEIQIPVERVLPSVEPGNDFK